MTHDGFLFALTIWGGCLSTILATIKVWEIGWRNRLRLETSFWNGPDETDEITIVNLSSNPVLVSGWSLAWEPNLFHRRVKSIDVTPEYAGNRFKVDPKDFYVLSFSEADSFDSTYAVSRNRKLYLSMSLFGRKKPKKLMVYDVSG
jgi:hypothetical protein